MTALSWGNRPSGPLGSIFRESFVVAGLKMRFFRSVSFAKLGEKLDRFGDAR